MHQSGVSTTLLLTSSTQHIPSFRVQAPEKYLSTAVAFMNPHSTGSVKLRSADPDQAPLIDPNFLSHPLDRRAAIESIRDTLSFLEMPSLAMHRERIAFGPADGSEEEILVSHLFSSSPPMSRPLHLHSST